MSDNQVLPKPHFSPEDWEGVMRAHVRPATEGGQTKLSDIPSVPPRIRKETTARENIPAQAMPDWHECGVACNARHSGEIPSPLPRHSLDTAPIPGDLKASPFGFDL